jgi:hypothetical protein
VNPAGGKGKTTPEQRRAMQVSAGEEAGGERGTVVKSCPGNKQWKFFFKAVSETEGRWPDRVRVRFTVLEGACKDTADRVFNLKSQASTKLHLLGRGACKLKVEAVVEHKGWEAAEAKVITLPAEERSVVEVGVRGVDVHYDLQNVRCPEVVAPGKDPEFRVSYDILDPAVWIGSGTYEVLRKRDGKVIKQATPLPKGGWADGARELAWDGAVDKAPEFPDGYVTLQESPYLVKIKIDGGIGPKEGTAEVRVEFGDFQVAKAPKTHLKDPKDQAVWDALPDLPATDLVKVPLKSNLFMVNSPEMNDGTAYTEYEKLWGAGPRIPLVATVRLKNSKGELVTAPKGLGNARVLWDYTDPAQAQTTYLAVPLTTPPHTNRSRGAKPFVDRALAFHKEQGRPKNGDNCHEARGGKRRDASGGDAVMALVDGKVEAFPFAIKAGTKRWWAAFSDVKKDGDGEGQAGVVFRPARTAGDNYEVKAYLDLKKALDVEDDVPAGAMAEAAVGRFEVWREITVVKYYRKSAAVTGAMPPIAPYYEDAYIRVDDQGTKAITVLSKSEYDTLWTNAVAAVPANEVAALVKKYSLDTTVSHYGSPANSYVATFREYADVKSRIATNNPSWDAAKLQLALDNNRIGDEAAYATAVKNYASAIGRQICIALSKDEGLTILQFDATCDHEVRMGRSLNGEACGSERTKAGFALYATDAGTEQTPAHEVGHNLFLPHAPRIDQRLVNAGGGILPDFHDKQNRNCLMSYARPRPGFCGLCLLRLRGWKQDQFRENGPIDPGLTSITPAKAAGGSEVEVTLAGSGFAPGSEVKVSGTGITVSEVRIVSATEIKAKLTIAADAVGSPYGVFVSTPAGETGDVEFSVTPVLTKVFPPVMVNLGKPKTWALGLEGKNFTIDATASGGGDGAAIENSRNAAPDSMVADLVVGATAGDGVRKVKVTTPGGDSNELEVKLVPWHTVTKINPNVGRVGTTFAVELTCTNLQPDAQLVAIPGVTWTDVVVTAPDKITAKMAVAAGAKTGVTQVKVLSARGNESVDFLVVPEAPTLVSVSPVEGYIGETVPFELAGTNFIDVKSLSLGVGGLKLDGGKVNSPTQITGKAILPPTLAEGEHLFQVTTTGGKTTTVKFLAKKPPAPTLVSITPSEGMIGHETPVVLRGTNFIAVQSIDFGGKSLSMPDMAVASVTEITGKMAIVPDAATGARKIKVITTGGQTATVNFLAKLPPAPVLTAISETEFEQGKKYSVTLDGEHLLLLTAVLGGGSGIQVTSFAGAGDTQATAELTLADDAAVGEQEISVETRSGKSNGLKVTVKKPPVPVLTSIAPDEEQQGFALDVVLTGTDLETARDVKVDGTGVKVNSWSATDTEVTAEFELDDTATVGPRNVTVVTVGGESNAVVFEARKRPAPVLKTITPDAEEQSFQMQVTIEGDNLLHLQGGLLIDGAGLTVASMDQEEDGEIVATLDVAEDAAPGKRKIKVKTQGGESNELEFEVKARPAPKLTSVTPDNGMLYYVWNVRLDGENLLNYSAIELSDPEVTIQSVTTADDDAIELSLLVGAKAKPGDCKIKVKTAGGTSNEVTYRVDPRPAPALTSVAPVEGEAGETVTVVLTGTDLSLVESVAVSGSGVTVARFQALSDTEVEVDLKVADDAAPGDRNITVTTNSGTSGPVTWKVLACPAPTLTAISYDKLEPGLQWAVTLTGTNLAKTRGASGGGGGFRLAKLAVVSDTELTCEIAVDNGAKPGERTLKVKTPGGDSNDLPFQVIPREAPVLNSVSPGAGVCKSEFEVTISGANLMGIQAIAASDPKVTVAKVGTESDDAVKVKVTVAVDATVGDCELKVTTEGGESNGVALSIQGRPAPTFKARGVRLRAGAAGGMKLPGTDLLEGGTLTSDSDQVTVQSWSVTSETEILATLAIGTKPGRYNLTYTNRFGSVSCYVDVT